jgi:hypothetical protein
MPLVPLAHSDQVDQGARLLSEPRCRRRWLPQDASMRPPGSVTVTRPSRPATSRAALVARPPSSANTTSRSIEWALSSGAAGGARSRPGSTPYCSRHRYHDVRISGRTPWTASSPAVKLSQASAVLMRLPSASAFPLVACEAPLTPMFTPFIPSPLAMGRSVPSIVISHPPTMQTMPRCACSLQG